MQASDIMVSPVITVTPGTTVKELAKLLVDRGLSAVPVVDDKGHLAGIVSEGDLLHRAEIGTYRQATSGGLAPRIDRGAAAAGFISRGTEPVRELTFFSNRLGFSISVLHFDPLPAHHAVDDGVELMDTYDKFITNGHL